MAALAVVFAIATLLAHSVVSAVVAVADDAASTAARNFTIASPPSPTSSGPVTYVFGDSMSDVGNNNFFPMSLAKSNYPWYGIDYPNREATGRFTNGKTIGDYMAEKFSVPPPPPFLSLRMTGKDVLGILNETGIYFVQYLSFDEQISSFEIVKKAMIAMIGKEAAEAAVNVALFQIGLGSNDYINNFLQPFMADGTTYTHDQFIRLLITTLDRQLKRLYGLGAWKVAFNGLAPLGCIPSQRVRSTDGKCLSHVNDYALQFNAAAKKLLDGLNAKLPGAQMGLADCYSVVMELIEHPEKNGNVSRECTAPRPAPPAASVHEYTHLGATATCTARIALPNAYTNDAYFPEVGGLCLPNTRPCSDRSAFVFWDAYHTSDAANKVIADRLWADMMSAGQGGASAPPRVVGASSPAVAPSP